MAYDNYGPSTLDSWPAHAREALLMEQLRHERWRTNFYQALHRSLKAKAAADAQGMASASQSYGKGYGKAVAPASQVLDLREHSGNPREDSRELANVQPNTHRTSAEHLPLGLGNPLPLPLPLDTLTQTPVSTGEVTQSVTRNTEPEGNHFRSSREPHVRNEGKAED